MALKAPGPGAARPPPALPPVRAQGLEACAPGLGGLAWESQAQREGKKGTDKHGVSGLLSQPRGQHGQKRSVARATVHTEEPGAGVSGGHTTDEEEEQPGALPLQGRDPRTREPGQEAPELTPPPSAATCQGGPPGPPHLPLTGAPRGHSLLTTVCLLPAARGPGSSPGLPLPERRPPGPGSGQRSLGSTPIQSRGHCRVLP